jgi:hypothetical protein
MKKDKQLGICMDHSNALLIELSNDTMVSQKIESESIQKVESDNIDSHEIEGREHHQHQSAYYKKISDVILNYQEVLLFGPTDAKNELFNLIKEDHDFENIKIEIKNTDKMTEQQMYAFVIAFFEW